ncbi:CD0415/CD1112 family protein [Aerococcaceae bacterium NML180378]|nr:CD0415/CD1112 family protein [Aerococcaceae bacterium NML180378]
MFGLEERIKEWLVGGIEAMISFSQSNSFLDGAVDQLIISPSDFSSASFNLVKVIAENSILPIAGMIFTFIVVSDLINVFVAQNNLYDHSVLDIYKWIVKTSIGLLLVLKSFYIVNGIFHIGTYLANTVSTQSAEVNAGIKFASKEELMNESVGSLMFIFFIAVAIVVIMIYVAFTINIIILTRFMEIYLMLSVAPIPMSTLTNQTWENVGHNYIKNTFGMALQCAFIIIALAVHKSILNSNVLGEGIGVVETALRGTIPALVLGGIVKKSESFAKSVVGAF